MEYPNPPAGEGKSSKQYKQLSPKDLEYYMCFGEASYVIHDMHHEIIRLKEEIVGWRIRVQDLQETEDTIDSKVIDDLLNHLAFMYSQTDMPEYYQNRKTIDRIAEDYCLDDIIKEDYK